MKIITGYIFAFLLMVVIVSVLTFGLILLVFGALTFITWSLPASPIAWFLIIRVCISIGVFVGVLFLFSKQCREIANDFKGF